MVNTVDRMNNLVIVISKGERFEFKDVAVREEFAFADIYSKPTRTNRLIIFRGYRGWTKSNKWWTEDTFSEGEMVATFQQYDYFEIRNVSDATA